jgi:hypothetical protein
MPETVMYQREDWTDFRNLATLIRRAGVPAKRLVRVVLKELTDNGLDHGGTTRCGVLDDGTFYVEDDGNGIDGTPEEIAFLFSISRPLTSSKLIRLPTRGALGNGQRVIVGAVLSTGGTLVVRTRGKSIYLEPQAKEGTTAVRAVEPWDGTGTRIEISFGSDLKSDPSPMAWAKLAIRLANKGSGYKGKTSAFWYDSDSFWELCQAAGNRTVRDLIAQFQDCAEPKAGPIAEPYLNKTAHSLTRDEGEKLLLRARRESKVVKPSRLGEVGPLTDYPGYMKRPGEFEVDAALGAVGGTIPVMVEAWARKADRPRINLCVNRTPTTAEVWLTRDGDKKTNYGIYGCDLGYEVTVGQKHDFQFLVNIQAPYLPLLTDGKTPALGVISIPIVEAMEGAARRAAKLLQKKAPGEETNQKSLVIKLLPELINWASGGGKSRYSPRTLFYRYRDVSDHLRIFGKEPRWGTFNRIITDYEDEIGHDLPGIARDNRGVLIHPHTGEEIQLGTISIEKYKRPKWTFNKVLYCEKEGLFPVLRDSRWLERHDCALLTSKGFATRAARDVIDLLGDTDEPLTFFCIHDADASGTLIYDKLQNATKARAARKVEVKNLGLEPKEALKMGLSPEPVEKKKGKKGETRRRPVGDYVTPKWADWLQSSRIELNGMSSPQFLAWLDKKFERYDGKLIPPAPVLTARLEETVRHELREDLTRQVLKEANIDGRVNTKVEGLRPVLEGRADGLGEAIAQALDQVQDQPWTAPIDRIAEEIIDHE